MWHVTGDIWQVTHNTWQVVNIVESTALMFWDLSSFEDLEEKDESLIKSLSEWIMEVIVEQARRHQVCWIS